MKLLHCTLSVAACLWSSCSTPVKLLPARFQDINITVGQSIAGIPTEGREPVALSQSAAEAAVLEGRLRSVEWREDSVRLLGIDGGDVLNVELLGGTRAYAVLCEPRDGFESLIKAHRWHQNLQAVCKLGSLYNTGNGHFLVSVGAAEDGKDSYRALLLVRDWSEFEKRMDYLTISDLEKRLTQAIADGDDDAIDALASRLPVVGGEIKARLDASGAGYRATVGARVAQFRATPPEDLEGSSAALHSAAAAVRDALRQRTALPAETSATLRQLRRELADRIAAREDLAAGDATRGVLHLLAERLRAEPAAAAGDAGASMGRPEAEDLFSAAGATSAACELLDVVADERIYLVMGRCARLAKAPQDAVVKPVFERLGPLVLDRIAQAADEAEYHDRFATAAGMYLLLHRMRGLETAPATAGLLDALRQPEVRGVDQPLQRARQLLARLLAKVMLVPDPKDPASAPFQSAYAGDGFLASTRVRAVGGIVLGSLAEAAAALDLVGRTPGRFVPDDYVLDQTSESHETDHEPLRWADTVDRDNSAAVRSYGSDLAALRDEIERLSNDISAAQGWVGWDPGRMFDPRWEYQGSPDGGQTSIFTRGENLASEFARDRIGRWGQARAELARRYNDLLDNPPREVVSVTTIRDGVLRKDWQKISGPVHVGYRFVDDRIDTNWSLALKVNVRCLRHDGHKPCGIAPVDQWVTGQEVVNACRQHFVAKLSHFATAMVVRHLDDRVRRLANEAELMEGAWMRTFLLSGLEPLGEGDQSLADMLDPGIQADKDPVMALRQRMEGLDVRRR